MMKNSNPFPSGGLKCVRGLAISALVLAILAPSIHADDDERHTANVGNINLVVTNYGTVGVAFAERGRHSCEYPSGSHIEHMFLGGLWVGGIRNNEIAVSTGAIDVSSKPNGAPEGIEFTTGDATCSPGPLHPE